MPIMHLGDRASVFINIYYRGLIWRVLKFIMRHYSTIKWYITSISA